MQSIEYHFFFFCIMNGGGVLPPKTQSFKDFVREKNCLCVCLFIYNVHGQINLLFKMWKLHRTRKETPSYNEFQYASWRFAGIHT
jgi:hypothetical protein